MSSLQNITFSAAPAQKVARISVRFEYKQNADDPEWRAFQYTIPDDMFDIRVDDRERIAIDLIRVIALGKGHIDEEGNILV